MKKFLNWCKNAWKKTINWFANPGEFKGIWVLYAFWVVYGAWLLMKAVTFAVFDLPVTRGDVVGASMIAFIWFIFYIIGYVSERQWRKLMRELNNIYKEHNDFLTEQNKKLIEGWEKAIKELEALENKNNG